LEQHHANFLFEIVYLPADPRLGDVQLPRGGRETAMLSNSAKVSEVTQLHMKAAYHKFIRSQRLS
jgi:hypothetical protein